MSPLVVSRRTVLGAAAAAGLLVSGTGRVPAAFAQRTDLSGTVPKSYTVAAIQTPAAVSECAPIVRSVATQVDADLFVVRRASWSGIAALRETARCLQRHIAMLSTGHQGLVMTPDGSILAPDDNLEPVILTPFGRLAFGPVATADLALIQQPIGYDRRSISAFCHESQCVAAVMTDVSRNVAPAETATAIFGSDGRVLSQTGPRWTQAIAAVVPLRRPQTVS